MTQTLADPTEISDTTSTTPDIAGTIQSDSAETLGENRQADSVDTPDKGKRKLPETDLVATLQYITTMPGFLFSVHFVLSFCATFCS